MVRQTCGKLRVFLWNTRYRSTFVNTIWYASPFLWNTRYRSTFVNTIWYASPFLWNTRYRSAFVNTIWYASPFLWNTRHRSTFVNTIWYASPNFAEVTRSTALHEYPSSGSLFICVQTDGRTDRTGLIGAPHGCRRSQKKKSEISSPQ